MTNFVDKAVIDGDRVRLRPIVSEDAADMLADIADVEALRMTGTRATFTPDDIRRWTSTRADTVGRTELAVVEHRDRTVARRGGRERLGSGRWEGQYVDAIMMSIVRSNRGDLPTAGSYAGR